MRRPTELHDTGEKTILLVEDDADIRKSLKPILEEDYRVLEASDYLQALTHIHKHIDIAIIDYALPDRNGFEVLKAIRKVKPTLPAIMMTGYSTEDLAIMAVKSGFTDYIKKPLNIPYFLKAIDRVLKESENVIPAEASGELKNMDSRLHRNYGSGGVLSEREIEVLGWIKQGKTNWEISSILGISENTVKFHIRNIMKKLDCYNRTHLVAIAIEKGLIK